MQSGGEGEAAQAAEAAARRSYGKLVAFLAAHTRDVAAAEDALSEAFARALSEWPKSGVPANPEGWLMTVARRRLIDAARRRQTRDAAEPDLINAADEAAMALHDGILDQRLALMFACAHPAIDEAVRAPLILQAVLGVSADVIASTFLASPAAMAKRLVRAKEKIRVAGIPFGIPDRADLAPRLAAVLDAIYAAYAEGWTDPSGADLARRELTGEALFLARLAAELMPSEPEALSLAALILHAEARRAARRTAEGDYVPLDEQDTSLWDHALIVEADSLLGRAGDLGGLGRYELEAAIQSAHAHRRLAGHDNWRKITALYEALGQIAPSPLVDLNRAIALAEVEGPQAALAAMPDPASDERLASYQPWWAARADLLARTGAHAEAASAYDQATGLQRDPAVRRWLQQRKARLAN
jgi:RNA polymerase sigma-70 factor (ECF subfamily)